MWAKGTPGPALRCMLGSFSAPRFSGFCVRQHQKECCCSLCRESQSRAVCIWNLPEQACADQGFFLPPQNGDYNKPIPAQYMEHLNHVVSSVPRPRDPAQPQQWVSSQVLLCRRCSHHQTTKIKQLAAFTPREEVSTRG